MRWYCRLQELQTLFGGKEYPRAICGAKWVGDTNPILWQPRSWSSSIISASVVSDRRSLFLRGDAEKFESSGNRHIADCSYQKNMLPALLVRPGRVSRQNAV